MEPEVAEERRQRALAEVTGAVPDAPPAAPAPSPIVVDVLVNHILARLTLNLLAKCEMVSQEWKRIVYVGWNRFDLGSERSRDHVGLLNFASAKSAHLPQLRYLRLNYPGCPIYLNHLPLITASNLTTLILETSQHYLPRELCLSRAPLQHLSIISANALLLSEAWIAHLAPTLTFLALHVRRERWPSEEVIDWICKYLGPKLEVLFIQTHEWQLFKNSMRALKELYVGITYSTALGYPQTINAAAAVLLDKAPPAIGLHVGFIPDSIYWSATFYETLLSRAMATTIEALTRALDLGCDPYRPLRSLESTKVDSILHRMWSTSSDMTLTLAMLQQMDKRGLLDGPRLGPSDNTGGVSHFMLAILEGTFNAARIPVVQWLFQNKWEEARKVYSAEELLHVKGLPPAIAVVKLSSNYIRPRLEFIAAHPEYFGESPMKQTDVKGCGILHHNVTWGVFPSILATAGLDRFKDVDCAGLNALECLARNPSNLICGLIADKLTDNEWKQYVTPRVWATAVCAPTAAALEERIERLYRLVPRDKRQEYVTQLVHTQIRSENTQQLRLIWEAGLSDRAVTRALLDETSYDLDANSSFYNIESRATFQQKLGRLISGTQFGKVAWPMVRAALEAKEKGSAAKWNYMPFPKGPGQRME